MNVVVVDAGSIGKKWQPGIFVLEFRAGCLKGAERSPVFPLGRVWLIFLFIEPGERALRLPLQKHRAILRLRDLAERALGRSDVMLSRGNLPLDQPRINLVALVAIGSRHREGFGCVAFRIVQLSGLLGNECQALSELMTSSLLLISLASLSDCWKACSADR